MLVIELIEKQVSVIAPNCETNCPDYSSDVGMPAQNQTVVKRAVITDKNAREEMTFYNWQPGHEFEEYGDEFRYDETAGNNVPVYIIDSGANLNNVRRL